MERKCKLCGKKGIFTESGFEEMRRYRCPNCNGYMIPWFMRHFNNKYVGYPKWVSAKDWKNRTFAPKLALSEEDLK